MKVIETLHVGMAGSMLDSYTQYGPREEIRTWSMPVSNIQSSRRKETVYT